MRRRSRAAMNFRVDGSIMSQYFGIPQHLGAERFEQQLGTRIVIRPRVVRFPLGEFFFRTFALELEHPEWIRQKMVMNIDSAVVATIVSLPTAHDSSTISLTDWEGNQTTN